jgi:hypothetical protein
MTFWLQNVFALAADAQVTVVMVQVKAHSHDACRYWQPSLYGHFVLLRSGSCGCPPARRCRGAWKRPEYRANGHLLHTWMNAYGE